MDNIKWSEVTWYSRWGALILFLIIVPIIAFFIGQRYQEVKELKKVEEDIVVDTGTSSPVSGVVSFSSKTTSSTISDVDFKITSPVFSYPSNESVEEKINKAIDQEIREITAIYQKNVQDIPCTNSTSSKCKSFVDIIATTTVSKRLNSVSVEYDVFLTSEAMAHPDYERERTTHFDLRTGEKKTYFEILGRDKTEILNKLSTVARKKLSASLNINQNSAGADTFENGTAPTEENYRNVLLDEEGLLVSFSEYQLGARPLGAPQIFIRYNELDLPM
jgi:hypothetical protein